MAYIRGVGKSAGCIFCRAGQARKDADNLLLHRGRHSFVIMNRFPYSSAHLMIAPYAHVDSLEKLADEATLELIRLTNFSLSMLRTCVRPEGFNIGINLGRVSGAGIETHVHLHVVPRWNGDTNFMPILAETRVIPEHLQATYRKLRSKFRLNLPKNEILPKGEAGNRHGSSRQGRSRRKRSSRA